MNQVTDVVDEVKAFAKDSAFFLNKCQKPDKKGKHE